MSPQFQPVFDGLRDILKKHAGNFIVSRDTTEHYQLEAPVGPATLRAWSGKVRSMAIPVDDPKNWYRAFREEQPSEVKVIHSKYWRSDHFTVEFIYYFEVEATPEWRDKFFAKHNLEQVSSETARSFRTNNSGNETPDWFAPDPVGRYDVWDKPEYFGSVWIAKTNGHIFFYDAQL